MIAADDYSFSLVALGLASAAARGSTAVDSRPPNVALLSTTACKYYGYGTSLRHVRCSSIHSADHLQSGALPAARLLVALLLIADPRAAPALITLALLLTSLAQQRRLGCPQCYIHPPAAVSRPSLPTISTTPLPSTPAGAARISQTNTSCIPLADAAFVFLLVRLSFYSAGLQDCLPALRWKRGLLLPQASSVAKTVAAVGGPYLPQLSALVSAASLEWLLTVADLAVSGPLVIIDTFAPLLVLAVFWYVLNLLVCVEFRAYPP